MQIAPLALVVLLGYGLLIAVCLTVWSAASIGRRERSVQSRRSEPAPAPEPQKRRERIVSNDQVRGERAAPTVHQVQRDRDRDEDAFERFLRAGADDRDMR